MKKFRGTNCHIKIIITKNTPFLFGTPPPDIHWSKRRNQQPWKVNKTSFGNPPPSFSLNSKKKKKQNKKTKKKTGPPFSEILDPLLTPVLNIYFYHIEALVHFFFWGGGFIFFFSKCVNIEHFNAVWNFSKCVKLVPNLTHFEIFFSKCVKLVPNLTHFEKIFQSA